MLIGEFLPVADLTAPGLRCGTPTSLLRTGGTPTSLLRTGGTPEIAHVRNSAAQIAAILHCVPLTSF
jgi:hypothetical protein